jgi:hypothetical protein
MAGPDYNGDGVVTTEEAARFTKEQQTAAGNVPYGTFPTGGSIVVPGFGAPGGRRQLPGGGFTTAEKYADYLGGSSSQVKSLFTVLASKNDPRLMAWMQSVGAASYADARSIWNKAVDYAADLAYSGQKVDLFEILGSEAFYAENFKLFGGDSGGGGGRGPRTVTQVSLTNANLARQNLQRDMKAIIGRPATEKELNEYVKKLHSAQEKFASKAFYSADGNLSRTTGSGFDEDAFSLQYILNKAGGKFEGGTLKATLDGIKTLAANYGVDAASTPTKFKQLTKQLLMQETTEEAISAQFSNSAASLFPAWSEYIKQTPAKSLYDIASDYVGVYANMLEIDPDQVNLVDVLNKATLTSETGSKVGSLSDMQRALRADDRYQFTGRAKQEAAAFGASFARSMGVNL